MGVAMRDVQAGGVQLRVHGVGTQVAYLRRGGNGPPLVCLHGFGSTKEDYADLLRHPAFEGRALLLLDSPGHGGSAVDEPDALSIPFLVDVVLAACDALDVSRFHLCGHSMGGLTGLMLAHQHPTRVLSFIDIEGNLAPEDCFLSRQIYEYDADDAEQFFQTLIVRISQSREYSSSLYAFSLPLKVRSLSIRPTFVSMVALSDHEPLLEMMTGLRCPRVFIYGEQNAHLSYLGALPARGVDVVEIPFSGHFPMYSNPPMLWAAMAHFLSQQERCT